MRYEWDERKRRLNLEKHGFDFADVSEVFDGPHFTRADTREDYGEERWQALGLLGFAVVSVVYTEPRMGVRRLISLRRASRHEKELFEKAL